MATLDEPLLSSAPMAWALAPTLCATDPVTGENCAPYHRLWQYLRILGLVETPPYHAAFFHETLRSVAHREARPRVLVSGTADYSMLAYVVAAFRSRGVDPDVTVLDVCRTPLALNQWYAKRIGLEITTHQVSILDYEAGDGFDVICTHAFLGRFTPPERVTLFGCWKQALRPGGHVITVSPVRPGHPEPMVSFTPEQVEAFAAQVASAAKSFGDRFPVDGGRLAEAARDYARQRRVFPVRGETEVRELLDRSGLGIVRLDHLPSTKSDDRAGRGPTVVGTAEYVRLVAVRHR